MTTLEKPKSVTLDLTADEATELVDYVLWSKYPSAADDLQSASEASGSVTTRFRLHGSAKLGTRRLGSVA